MLAITKIESLLLEERILSFEFTPYVWETESEITFDPKQVNTFLLEIENFAEVMLPMFPDTSYFIGHFIIKEEDTNRIIDGHHRICTITLLIAALVENLLSNGPMQRWEQRVYEKLKSNISYGHLWEAIDFSPLAVKKSEFEGFQAQYREAMRSCRNLRQAFEYFSDHFSRKDEHYHLRLLSAILNATCSIHFISHPIFASQVKSFQHQKGFSPRCLVKIG